MWFWNELSSLAEVSLYNLSNPTVILTFSWYTLFSQTRKWRPSHSGITVSPGMEEIPSLNKPFQMLKITTLPPDLPCSGPLTHSGEILTTGKSHAKKSDRFLQPSSGKQTTVSTASGTSQPLSVRNCSYRGTDRYHQRMTQRYGAELHKARSNYFECMYPTVDCAWQHSYSICPPLAHFIGTIWKLQPTA